MARVFDGARKMRPTQKHRPAIWEGILGAVYANDGIATRYFDYDYEGALEYAGGTDPRVYRAQRSMGPALPSKGQLVLWVRR